MISMFLVALISVAFISYISYKISKLIIASFIIDEIEKKIAFKILLTLIIITIIAFLLITYFN
jgi:hypothetical protein